MIDDQTKKPDLYTPIALKHLYANLYCFERDAQQEWKKQLFVPRWMGDVHIRQVKRSVVDPDSHPVVADDGEDYNMWPGVRGRAAAAGARRRRGGPDHRIEPIVRHQTTCTRTRTRRRPSSC